MYSLFITAALVSSTVTVTDGHGHAVAGALIVCDGEASGVTDLSGMASFPAETDTLQVTAMGYRSWKGPAGDFMEIFLEPIPVSSGLVITSRARPGLLRNTFPATTVLGSNEMWTLGTAGMGRLNSLSGGVYVREYGGSMPVVSFSLRGGSAAHTDYLVDGHGIGSAMDGLPGMYLDPLLFGGLEVARGNGSAFTMGGMSGSINFLTESASRPPRVSLTAGDDGSLTLSGSLGMDGNRYSASLRRNRGISGTTGYSGGFLFGGNRFPFSYGALATVSAGETESPEWTVESEGYRERCSGDAWVKWGGETFYINTGLRGGRHEYRDNSTPESLHKEMSASVSARCEIPLSRIRVNVSGRSELARVWSSTLGRRDRSCLEAAAGAEYSGGVSIASSFLANWISGSSAETAAVLSFGIPMADSVFNLHTSASTGFRRPTLNDLYWPEDNFAEGNSNLRPEHSKELEAGIGFSPSSRLNLSLNAYTGESTDLIRWEPGSQGKWTPQNIASVRRRGLEAELRASGGALEATGTLTLMEMIDNCSESVNYGSVLPYTPDYVYSLRIALDLTSWAVWSLDVSGMGLRYMNYSETSWMDAYSLISCGVRLHPPFTEHISLDASVHNLLNEDYMETSGYAGRPRTVYLGIIWKGNRTE